MSNSGTVIDDGTNLAATAEGGAPSHPASDGNDPPASAWQARVLPAREAFARLGLLARTVRERGTFILNSSDERSLSQRNALSAFAVRVGSAALLYLMQIVLARWMGSFEYGIYIFVWTWVLVLGGIAPLGLELLGIRLVPEYREQGRWGLLRGLLFGFRATAFVVASGLAALGFLGLYLFGSLLDNHYVLPAYLALICVPIYAVGDVQDGMGRGFAWINIALVPPYILRPLLILLAMVGAHAAGLPMEATTAAGAAIAGTLLSTGLQLCFLQRAVGKTVPAGPREYAFPVWLRASAPLLVIVTCELLFQNADVLVISTFLSPESVAIYFAAAKTMSLIMFVHYAVGSAVANRFSALKARGDDKELRDAVRDAVRWTFWPSLASAVVILALGRPLLSLFGPAFDAGYPVMFILVLGFLLRSAMGPAEFLLNMLGEQSRCAQVLVGCAILNVVLNLVLVPMFGIVGAASATSVSLMTAAMVNYLVVRSRLGFEIAIWKNL